MRGHAISNHGFPSDTNLLVDACIARVRETARLDDDAVLPPLPRVAPRLGVVIFAKDPTAARRTTDAKAGDELIGSRSAVTQNLSRRGTSPRRSRWALALCALVAAGFGAGAFLASPAGHTPSVIRATTAARARVVDGAGAAARATAALFAR